MLCGGHAKDSTVSYNAAMPLTIFYAWQSDTDRHLNYSFIRQAAEEAIKRLRADAAVEDAPDIELDHDTKGVTGTPAIAETIKAKIRDCTIFLGDMTHVCKYTSHDRRDKRSPNPNVLVELGIAMAGRGEDRIVLVQNTAFGGPEELPFDLRHHRFPIRYDLGDRKDADFDKKLKAVTDKLVEALKPIIEAELKAKGNLETKALTEIAAARQGEVTAQRADFEKAVADEGEYEDFHFYDLEPDLKKKSVGPLLTLTLFPIKAPVERLDLGSIYSQVRRDMRPLFVNGWEHEVFVHSIINHNSISRPYGIGDFIFKRAKSLVALTDDGCILAAEGLLPDDAKHTVLEPATVDFYHEERELLMRLREYVQMLRDFGVHLPLLAGLSILRPGGIRLHVRKLGGLRSLNEDIVASLVPIPPIADVKDNVDTIRVISKAMRPALNTIWRAAGLPNDPFFDAEGQFH